MGPRQHVRTHFTDTNLVDTEIELVLLSTQKTVIVVTDALKRLGSVPTIT